MAFENDFRFGFILAKIGLKMEEVDALIRGTIELDKDSKVIREFILSGAEHNSTLLRRLVDMGLSLDTLSSIFYPNKDLTIYEMNIDNPTYRINTLDIGSKINIKVREMLIDALCDHGVSSKSISIALDIGYSTVRGYLK